MFFLLCILMLLHRGESRAPLSIRIGGVFRRSSPEADTMLPLAVSYVNSKQDLLNETRIDSFLKYADDSHVSAYTVTCDEFEQRVLAVVSSADTLLDPVVGSLADKYAIPHFATGLEDTTRMVQSNFSIHLAPSRDDLTRCILELTLSLGLERVGVVSHSPTSVLHTTSLVDGLQAAGLEVLLIDLAEKDIRPDLSRLRKKGFYACIVDISPNLIKTFIGQAMQSGLVSSETTFIFTSLDFSGVSLELGRYSGSTILGLSLLDSKSNLQLNETVTALVETSYKSAVLFDSVLLLSHGLQYLSESTDPQIPRVSCENRTGLYEGGRDLMDSLEEVTVQGITGTINLQGRMREEMMVKVLMFDPRRTRKVEVGAWNRDLYSSWISSDLRDNVNTIRNEGKENLVLVAKDESLEAEAIIRRVAEKHEAEFRVVRNTSDILENEVVIYWDESIMEDEEIRQLSKRSTESVIADGLDWTATVSTTGIYLVTKMDEIPSLNWILITCILISLAAASISLSLSSRISPVQRRASTYSVQDSLWITLAGLLFRTWDTKLQGVSSRMISLVWWTFCLFIFLYSSLQFLLHPRDVPSVDQLLHDPDLSLHSLQDSSLHGYMEISPTNADQLIMDRIQPSLRTVEEGLNRIHAEKKMVLILDGSRLPELGCGYKVKKISSRPQMFWLRRDSTWRRRINAEILAGSQTKPHHSKPNQPSAAAYEDLCSGSSFSSSTIYHYGVGFVLVGCLISLLISVSELVIFSIYRSRNSFSWWKILCQELKFMMRGSESEEGRRTTTSPDSREVSSPQFSPEKYTPARDSVDEPRVTDKLIRQRALEEKFENSRL